VKVKLDKKYPVAASADAAWNFLQDIKSVASCMPGAEITGQSDETHFKGMVKIKVGPAVAAFKGDIEVKGIDTEKKQLVLLGKGGDTKGTSSVSMLLTASIRETTDGHCELIGQAEITVNGKLASFGGRMMDSISERVHSYRCLLSNRAKCYREIDPVEQNCVYGSQPYLYPVSAREYRSCVRSDIPPR